ncbi:N-acetylmuramoyl-L-alanine amidase [Bacillus sp. 1P06AnD]|uniref:N-acetylmuramoyl-L-alanine amidase n=1 Tax=Bacillus sp. 1P06AnD TaxID=3132208 RepID=UPI0039A17D14
MKTIRFLTVAIMAAGLLFSGHTASAKEKIAIKDGSINARSGPGTQYEKVGRVHKGDEFSILQEEQGWYKVKLDSGELVWIASWLTEKAEVQDKEEPKMPYAEITATELAVRKQPSLSAKKMGSVKKADTFSILDEKNNWYRIEYKNGKKGWIPSWFSIKIYKPEAVIHKDNAVKATMEDAPIREKANANGSIKKLASKGDTYDLISIKGDYYKVKTGWGKTGYVSSRLASVSRSGTPAYAYDLRGKVIIIDPGHGGNDSGTTGKEGTLEKNLTLSSALLLKEKLEHSGATVLLTRSDDRYIALSERTSKSFLSEADAFLSLHYDSAEQNNVRGITPYYYHSFQKPLAQAIYSNLEAQESLKIRDKRFGDYHVLRQNSQPAVLLELGYLSNMDEEELVTSPRYQHDAATAIYNGLGSYLTGTRLK